MKSGVKTSFLGSPKRWSSSSNRWFLMMSAAVLSLCLAACGGGDAEEPASRVNGETGTSSVQSGESVMERKEMEMRCAGVTMNLVRNEPVGGLAKDAVSSTALYFVAEDGQSTVIAMPAEMSGYTAVGLGCAQAVDGDPYFTVQYGELPTGCRFCEWFYLYDARGKQLTQSNPPLFEDASLPEGQQQSPNNAEYEAMLTKLGIQHPEIDYIQ